MSVFVGSVTVEKTFVVCTMQMSPRKEQLFSDLGKRDVAVIHSKKDAALLTTVDVMLLNDFVC